MIQLLGRTTEMSLHGFMLLDRTIFPSLVGFFLTYFFLLLQFKMDEASDNATASATLTK